MKKIFKSTGDKIWFSFFIPVITLGYAHNGVTPLWLITTVLGVSYIAWNVYDAFKD